MKCIKCQNDYENGYCKNCNQSMEETYFEQIKKYQNENKTEEALDALHKLIELTKDEDVKTKAEKMVRTMQLAKAHNATRGRETDGMENVKKVNRESDIYRGMKKVLYFMLSLFLIAGISMTAKYVYYGGVRISKEQKDNRVLEMTFTFHLNQGSYSYADWGDKACYRGLIETLRKHKDMKFNLHVSGTLIQDLLWYSPKTLELIKEGVDDGQFEILGSTYAQNVMYSTDTQSNRWQIERHLELIKDVFGVRPKGFWNAERVWRQDLGKLMQEYGYEYTLVEDHITKFTGSKYPEYVVRTTENGTLTIINDDYEFMPIFNGALDAGDYEAVSKNIGANLGEKRVEYKRLFKYMRKVYNKDKDDNFVLSYAEDAEATGLWDLRDRNNPLYDFENLDYLLNEFKKYKWIKLVTLSEVHKDKRSVEDLTPIKDGVASWMEKAARGDGIYGESGYTSWFEFNSKSPKLKYYRDLYAKYQPIISENERSDNPAIKNLSNVAKDNFLSHQFEFGCTGIGGTDKQFAIGDREEIWENVRTMAVVGDAIENIKNGVEDKNYLKDVNDDGVKELVVINNMNYYVFSIERGGRILYWYDLSDGMEYVGNELPIRFDEMYKDDNYPVEPFNLGNSIRFFSGEKEFLDYLKNKTYYIRQKALNEKLIADKEDKLIENLYRVDFNYEINGENLTLTYNDFVKEINFNKKGFNVKYIIPEKAKGLNVWSEFQPDYFTVLNKGIKSLKTEVNGNKLTIFNIESGKGVKLEYPDNTEIEFKDALFGKIADMKMNSGDYFIKVEKY